MAEPWGTPALMAVCIAIYGNVCMYGYVCLYGYVCIAMHVWLCLHIHVQYLLNLYQGDIFILVSKRS